MNRLLLGALLGAFLAGLRLAPGAELLQWPVVEAEQAYRMRAGGLLLVAGALLCAGRILDGHSRSAWLVGIFVGVTLESLAGNLGPEDHSAAWPLVPVALVLLIMFSRRRPNGDGKGKPATAQATHLLPAVTAALIGMGFALGLEGTARVLRRLGGGLPLDDGVFASALALSVVVGGLSFGGLLAQREGKMREGKAHMAAGLVGALALLGSLIALRGVSTPRGLRNYLAHFSLFDLDASLFGQLPYDFLLGSLVFVLPGFALGALLHGTHLRSTLASLFLGAAAGLMAIPRLLDHGAELDVVSGPHSAELIRWGMCAIGLGGMFWCFKKRELLRAPSGLALGLGSLAAALSPYLIPVQQLRVLPAWERFPRPFAEVFDTPQGQFSIHPSAPGVDRVALDNLDLTPDRERGGIDARRLKAATALLDPERRMAGARALLIGQLTPGRALVLESEGIVHLDRTGAWWRSMEWLEQRLFRDRSDMRPNAGAILKPETARAGISAGNYDLVIALPQSNAAPMAPAPDLPDGTLAVAWFDGEATLSRRSLPEPVLVVSDGLSHLSLGLVWGATLSALPQPGRPAALRAGAPLTETGRTEWMFVRPDDRRRRCQIELAERLRDANADHDFRFLSRGLAEHFNVQERSSPWGDRAEKTEISKEALASLTEALTVGEPDALTREVWDGLAAVLAGKRDIEAIDTWLRPAAEIWPLWPALERAIALADLESLDPQAAITRMQALVLHDPNDFEAVRLLGKAHEQAGQPEQAAEVWQTLLDRQPESRRTRRKLALAWVAAGEFDLARPLLRDLLKENPEDRELWGLLNPTGTPESDEGFDPSD
jgi:tetratricopeptide (TPR) repeat protein